MTASSSTNPLSQENISFSFAPNCDSFQEGGLGDEESFLVGSVRLNYKIPCQIESVSLNLKGIEITLWSALTPRKKLYKGKHIFFDKSYVIWKPEGISAITQLDIPFKEKLPNDLPETIEIETGSVVEVRTGSNFTNRV
jgi:hypothetical protein